MRNIPIQFIVVVILLAFSGLSWLFRQLKAQQAQKQARDRAEHRQVETLRTGRDPDEGPLQNSAESQRQRELAARRMAQLAELRARAQQRADQQGHETSHPQTPASAPTAPVFIPQHIPGSTGPTVPSYSPARIAPRQTARVQSQSQPLPAVRAKQKQSAPTRAAAHTTHVEEVAISKPAAPVVQVNSPRTPEEWRRAIIATEIMAQPLSLRSGPPSLPF